MRATPGGEFLLEQSGAPVDRVKRQLWGVPGALNTAIPVGTAYVLAQESVTLFTDGVVDVSWGSINDDFGKNQIRARAESRFEVGTLRPLGVVSIRPHGVTTSVGGRVSFRDCPPSAQPASFRSPLPVARGRCCPAGCNRELLPCGATPTALPLPELQRVGGAVFVCCLGSG